ncbi:MAG: hypothetical protein IJV40_02055 [Oscillospiraceae bacterium]|nr:hypothetical protein [Oscillospiraceae bacterium]
MKHILICGGRNSGKSILFERLLNDCRVPLYGFTTGITTTREDGYHEIYMFPVRGGDRTEREENHVGSCNMKERTVNIPVFETLGVKLMEEARPDGILCMDELGFMEAKAPAFCRKVLECLDGEIPVLATVRDGMPEIEFLNRVRSHPGAECWHVRPDNIDELYETLSPIIERWNKR